jgi:hypothetical protein
VFGPIFEKASEANPDVVFGKLNTEDQPVLAGSFGIQAIPTLMAFRDGILIFEQAGALPGHALQKLIEQIKALDIIKVREKVEAQGAAVGADSPDKQELEPALVASSRVVVDILEQCARVGELHHALEADLMTEAGMHGDLGDIVAGKLPGRTGDDEIIVFDTTGSAIRDTAAAVAVYRKALARGAGGGGPAGSAGLAVIGASGNGRHCDALGARYQQAARRLRARVHCP